MTTTRKLWTNNYVKRRQKERVDKNLCTKCGKNKPRLHYKRCEDCINKLKSWRKQTGYDKELYTFRKQHKLCVRCGVCLTNHKIKCDECSELSSNRITKRRLAGLCVNCKNKSLNTNALCEVCWFKNLAHSSLGVTTAWSSIKELIIKQKYKCAYTGKSLIIGDNASIDHIVPKKRGGTNTLDNLQWVDLSVNLMKRDMLHDDFLKVVSQIYNNLCIRS